MPKYDTKLSYFTWLIPWYTNVGHWSGRVEFVRIYIKYSMGWVVRNNLDALPEVGLSVLKWVTSRVVSDLFLKIMYINYFIFIISRVIRCISKAFVYLRLCMSLRVEFIKVSRFSMVRALRVKSVRVGLGRVGLARVWSIALRVTPMHNA